jgi:hypothetical protein
MDVCDRWLDRPLDGLEGGGAEVERGKATTRGCCLE